MKTVTFCGYESLQHCNYESIRKKLYDVIDDIHETAAEDFNDTDIKIAFGRVLKSNMVAMKEI